jgi:hypothetical protein
MVWFIILFPVLSVVMGMTILYYAITTYDGLVVDDYYQQGKNINRVLARDHAAQSYGLEGVLDLRSGRQTVQLQLKAVHMKVLPPRIKLSFFHATRAGLDHMIYAEQKKAGDYEVALPMMEQGRWSVQAEADNWRLVGSLMVPGDGHVVMAPGNAR